MEVIPHYTNHANMKSTLQFVIEKVMNWVGICGSMHELIHRCQEMCPADSFALPHPPRSS